MDFNDDFSYFSPVKASMDYNNKTTTKQHHNNNNNVGFRDDELVV